jgi:hypothetical protein
MNMEKIKQQLPAGERLDLIRQVFERCKRLKLQVMTEPGSSPASA